LKNKHKGGGGTRSNCSNRHSNRLVIIIYTDHVLGRNSNPKLYKSPNIREAVGWLTYKEDDFVVLINDRSVTPLPYEVRENFLIILKSNIVEIKEIE